MWFPELDGKVELTVKQCNACQLTGPSDRPAPVITETAPISPWQIASAGFGSLPDGRQLFVVIDYFSKYPEVEFVSSTSTEDTIPKMEKIIATHRLLGALRTDNRPPFTSQEWATYLQSYNIKHRKITPRWPQANGEAERFTRTITKTLQIAQAGEQNVERAVFTFLREYQLTPHSTTGFAPSFLCLGRRVGDVIPHHSYWETTQLPANET